MIIFYGKYWLYGCIIGSYDGNVLPAEKSHVLHPVAIKYTGL